MALNLERKAVELLIKIGGEIRPRAFGGLKSASLTDFKVFGRNEDRVVALSSEGLVTLCLVCYDLKRICTKYSYQVQLAGGRGHPLQPMSLAACDKGEIVLVGFAKVAWDMNCRIIVFGLKGRVLAPRFTYDFENLLAPRDPFFLTFCSRFRNHILWIGMFHRKVSFYCLDVESGELKELVDYKMEHGWGNGGPEKLHRIGEEHFFYWGVRRLMRLTVRT